MNRVTCFPIVPVSVKRLDQDKDADENVDADQTRTETTREWTIVVHSARGHRHRLQSVWIATCTCDTSRQFKKIESHPYRRGLQADLKQNNAYNPFSEESNVMIRDMGFVELFKLCETILKVQCLLYWNQGTVFCTCGHFSKESESSHNFHQWRLEAFSIQEEMLQ